MLPKNTRIPIVPSPYLFSNLFPQYGIPKGRIPFGRGFQEDSVPLAGVQRAEPSGEVPWPQPWNSGVQKRGCETSGFASPARRPNRRFGCGAAESLLSCRKAERMCTIGTQSSGKHNTAKKAIPLRHIVSVTKRVNFWEGKNPGRLRLHEQAFHAIISPWSGQCRYRILCSHPFHATISCVS